MTRAKGKKIIDDYVDRREKFFAENRKRGEAALEKLIEAKRWLAFHSESLDPTGAELKRVEDKIAEVKKYLNVIPPVEWPDKIDGLWHQAEQIALANLP